MCCYGTVTRAEYLVLFDDKFVMDEATWIVYLLMSCSVMLSCVNLLPVDVAHLFFFFRTYSRLIINTKKIA